MAQPEFGAVFNAFCDIANGSRAIATAVDSIREQIDNIQNYAPHTVLNAVEEIKNRVGVLEGGVDAQGRSIQELRGQIVGLEKEILRLCVDLPI